MFQVALAPRTGAGKVRVLLLRLYRDVAQLVRAVVWEATGRRFESYHPDSRISGGSGIRAWLRAMWPVWALEVRVLSDTLATRPSTPTGRESAFRPRTVRVRIPGWLLHRPLAQSAEATSSKGVRSGFESLGGDFAFVAQWKELPVSARRVGGSNPSERASSGMWPSGPRHRLVTPQIEGSNPFIPAQLSIAQSDRALVCDARGRRFESFWGGFQGSVAQLAEFPVVSRNDLSSNLSASST